MTDITLEPLPMDEAIAYWQARVKLPYADYQRLSA